MGETLEHPETTLSEYPPQRAELEALAEQANREAMEELNALLNRSDSDPYLDVETARANLAGVGESSPSAPNEATPNSESTAESQPTSPSGDEAKPESDPNRAAETRRIIALIDQRKELRHEADDLRVQALQLALDHDLLNQFPALEPWEADGLKQGLINKPSAPTPLANPDERETMMSQIQTHIDQAEANESQADVLTAEIKKGVSS